MMLVIITRTIEVLYDYTINVIYTEQMNTNLLILTRFEPETAYIETKHVSIELLHQFGNCRTEMSIYCCLCRTINKKSQYTILFHSVYVTIKFILYITF